MVYFYSHDILKIQQNSIAQKIGLTDFVNKIFLNAKFSVVNDMKKIYLEKEHKKIMYLVTNFRI